MFGYIVISAFVLYVISLIYNKLILPRILKATIPKEKDILTTLISCRLLADRQPFLSSDQIQSIHDDGYLISNEDLIHISVAALFRIYIFRIVTFWENQQLTQNTLNIIQNNFPDEWEILSAMFNFEASNQISYKTKDDAIKYTSGWIASALIQEPCAESKSIAQTFYTRLHKSRI